MSIATDRGWIEPHAVGRMVSEGTAARLAAKMLTKYGVSMRIPAQQNHSGLQVNITPLIDVVFLLIIFFLVASHFIRSETREPIELPTATQGQDEEVQSRRRLVLTVNSTGQLFVVGESVTTEEVRSMIMAGRAEHGSAFELRIRGDKQAAFGAVRPIIKWCADSGITKLKFAVADDR